MVFRLEVWDRSRGLRSRLDLGMLRKHLASQEDDVGVALLAVGQIWQRDSVFGESKHEPQTAVPTLLFVCHAFVVTFAVIILLLQTVSWKIWRKR